MILLFAVEQKLTQHCKSTIIKNRKKTTVGIGKAVSFCSVLVSVLTEGNHMHLHSIVRFLIYSVKG